MSEMREALENIGRRFTPPDQSVEKIMAGVGGMKRRRLLGMTLVVVLAGIPLAAGAWALLSAPPPPALPWPKADTSSRWCRGRAAPAPR